MYPISSFTWLLFREPEGQDQARGWWTSSVGADHGQKFANPLGYAPLPEAVVKLEMAALAKVKIS